MAAIVALKPPSSLRSSGCRRCAFAGSGYPYGLAKRKSESRTAILLIALFKLLKGLSLLLLGFGLLRLLHRDIETSVTHWIEMARIDPENRHIHGLLVKIFAVTPKQLKALSAGTLVYAALFLTEGTGLLLRKRWAEYMTVITTSLFIPLEVYEIWHHPTALRVAILVINVATVWYLARNLRR